MRKLSRCTNEYRILAFVVLDACFPCFLLLKCFVVFFLTTGSCFFLVISFSCFGNVGFR